MRINTPNDTTHIDVQAHNLPPTFPIVLPVCREIGIASIVDRLCPMKRGDHLTHGQVAEFLILHLLQAPQRLPLYQLEEWAAEHNIHELYGRRAGEFNDDRIGRTLDALAHSVADVETAVVTKALSVYRIDAKAIHWDLTHITFAGLHGGSDLICKGYGAGKVHDRQLQVSLHVTSDGGVPVRHEALKGSAHQAPLAPDILKDLQRRLPTSDLIVVSDRAGITYHNIKAYREGGAYFLGPLQIITPEHAQQLAAVPESEFAPLSYRSINKPHDTYSYYATTLELKGRRAKGSIPVDALFIHSDRAERQQREKRQRHIAKAIERLEEIAGHLNRARYAKAHYAREQIDKAGPPGVKDIVGRELSGEDRALTLRYWIDEEALARAQLADGRYILVYDLPSDECAHADDVFCLYRRQGVVEQRNRNLGTELSVHPLWLQDEDRIRALLLIFILALIVYTILELCSERAGLDTERYHKMTAKQMIRAFGGVNLKRVIVEHALVQHELVLSPDQTHILRELGFPDPTSYLQPTDRTPTHETKTEEQPTMCGK